MPVLNRLSWITRYLNPILRPVARRLPPMAVLHHSGRNTGTPYETPVQAFRTGDSYLVGLAYDSDAQWAKNLFAGGTATMTRRGRHHLVTAPRRRSTDALAALPLPVRLAMRALSVTDFIEFDASHDATT